MYNLNPVITKEYILKHLDQAQILEYYLGVKVDVNTKVKSPLRRDNNPSCSFKMINGTIYFKDWAQGFSGDWIRIIQYKYGITYAKALEKCAIDFGLTNGSVNETVVKIEYKPEKLEPKESKIEIKIRPWDQYDREFWSKYGINKSILTLYNVYPCEIVFYNSKVVYTRRKNDIAYAYRFGPGKYKIYMPQRNAFRWLSNYNSWQGLEQLPQFGDHIVITKSMKDVMALRQLGVVSAAPASEAVIPDDGIMTEISRRFTNIYSFMDFDLTGVKMANTLLKRYNIQPLFLTDGRFGTKDYGAKDISDYIEVNGTTETLKLINQCKYDRSNRLASNSYSSNDSK